MLSFRCTKPIVCLKCRTAEKKLNFLLLISLTARSVAAGMESAVIVIAALNKLNTRSGLTLLGIGQLYLAVSSFLGEESEVLSSLIASIISQWISSSDAGFIVFSSPSSTYSITEEQDAEVRILRIAVLAASVEIHRA